MFLCLDGAYHALEIDANDIELNSLYYELYFTCPICKEKNDLRKFRDSI